MSDFETGAQIVVSRSAFIQQLGSFARAALQWAGGYLAGKGYIDAGLSAALPPLLLTGAGLLWSFIANRRSQAVKVELADLLPDAVAVAK